MLRRLRVTMLWIPLLPVMLAVAGAASNQAVLIANHDKFPVMLNDAKLPAMTDKGSAPGMLDDTHCIMTPATHLNFMADVFDFGPGGINSIGDLLLEFGGWLLPFACLLWGAKVSMRLLQVS
jgi:Family of unknown function (DUF5317)